MRCYLCNDDIITPIVRCNCCGEIQTIIDSPTLHDMKEYLEQQYSVYKDTANQLLEKDWMDNYKTIAVKKTQVEVYKKALLTIEHVLKSYLGVDVDSIQIERGCVDKPRLCQLDHNKICNHCMNC